MKLNMNTLHPNRLTERQVLVTFAVLVAIACMATNNLHAGVDVTFTNPATLVTNWINGSYGKMAAIGALGVGLAIAVVKQSLMFVAGAVGIAVVASQGPGIINAIVTATL
jgi:conjugal transfer pilus assembly protein TraA